MEAEIKKDVSMRLLEEILSDSNITLAQSRVIGNRGAGGVDGVGIEELRDYPKMSIMRIRR
jgi:hypothetical protein